MPIKLYDKDSLFRIEKDGHPLAIGCLLQRPGASVLEWGVSVMVGAPLDLGFFPTKMEARKAAVDELKKRGVSP